MRTRYVRACAAPSSSLTIFCALFITACGGGDHVASPTPTQPAVNHAPIISSVNVEPTFGIAYLTTYSLKAQASDPDGDVLTYSWTVTDGTRVVHTASTQDVRTSFPMALLSAKARFTVSDSHGQTASGDTAPFVNASLNFDWMAVSPAFPGTSMFYVRLQQDSTGIVTGQIIDFDEKFLGSVQSGQINSSGRVTIRLRYNNGVTFTIVGQMQRDGIRIVGKFTNTAATFGGVAINGLPVTLEID